MSTTSSTATDLAADQALKAKHCAMPAHLGDYPYSRHRGHRRPRSTLVEASGIGPGDRVLDVAAGSGATSPYRPPRPAPG